MVDGCQEVFEAVSCPSKSPTEHLGVDVTSGGWCCCLNWLSLFAVLCLKFGHVRKDFHPEVIGPVLSKYKLFAPVWPGKSVKLHSILMQRCLRNRTPSASGKWTRQCLFKIRSSANFSLSHARIDFLMLKNQITRPIYTHHPAFDGVAWRKRYTVRMSLLGPNEWACFRGLSTLDGHQQSPNETGWVSELAGSGEAHRIRKKQEKVEQRYNFVGIQSFVEESLLTLVSWALYQDEWERSAHLLQLFQALPLDIANVSKNTDVDVMIEDSDEESQVERARIENLSPMQLQLKTICVQWRSQWNWVCVCLSTGPSRCWIWEWRFSFWRVLARIGCLGSCQES